jgi:esterase/lipase superfamily enzyme
MNREHHAWHSPSLNRTMELLVFGHHGAPVLVFPTSQGRFYEWEDFSLINAMSYHIEQGWNQFYCLDSVDAESWYCKGCHPADRVIRHMQYEQYILNEVIPFMRSKNDNTFLITTGASFGAYHAVNFAFRHPGLARRVIGMSGRYDMRPFMDGYYDENFYFNNPVDYMKNLSDHALLETFRHELDIILVTGRDSGTEVENNRYLSQILWDKGIWHALRVWDGWAHDWPWWKQMLPMYINGAG